MVVPTFALESLPEEAVQHGAAVVAEGEALVVADLEAVRHVDLKALLQVLRCRR